jgi:hypothetical protein
VGKVYDIEYSASPTSFVQMGSLRAVSEIETYEVAPSETHAGFFRVRLRP